MLVMLLRLRKMNLPAGIKVTDKFILADDWPG